MKKTETTQKNLIEAFRKTRFSVSAACVACGINRATFYRWLQEDEGFREGITEVREELLDIAEEQLHRHVSEGNMTAIMFVLKTKGKSRGYTERQEIDHTSSGNALAAPINIVIHGSASRLLDNMPELSINL